jgi:hypothetical protein
LHCITVYGIFRAVTNDEEQPDANQPVHPVQTPALPHRPREGVMQNRIRSAAARWKASAELAGVSSMPPNTQGVAVCMYFAGFQACLDATAEISALPTDEANEARAELERDVQVFNQLATTAMAAGRPN